MKRILFSAAVFLLIIVLVHGCGLFTLDEETSEVLYKVSSTAPEIYIRMINKYGQFEDRLKEKPPWTYKFKADPGDQLYLSAWHLQDSGEITVEIHVDGKLYRHARATGKNAKATVSGNI